MRSPTWQMMALGLLLGPTTAGVVRDTTSQFNAGSYPPSSIIRRDFVIVGGGAAGTYAAIDLKDQGKTFTIVELTNRLGGNTATYLDPTSGKSVDYALQLYNNESIVNDFFARLNTPLAPFSPSYFGAPNYHDFTKKTPVSNYSSGVLGADYQVQLDKYPYVQDVITTPNPVPSDLLLPWSDYLAKYPLSVSSTRASLMLPASPGDVLQELALYEFHNGNNVIVQEFSGNAVVNANRNNSELFVKATTELATNILFNSSVVSAQRSSSGVRLVVQTPKGQQLIIAKQLIMAIPPVSKNTKSFGLDSRESGLLNKVTGKYFYGGVVRNTGLSDAQGYINVGANTPYNVATLPSVVQFVPSAAPGVHWYWYNTLNSTSRAQIEAAAADTLAYLQRQANITNPPRPQFVEFRDFSPFHLQVSAQDIASGFYNNLNALQGYRNTWYIGSVLAVGSTQIWNNTKAILPSIIAAAA